MYKINIHCHTVFSDGESSPFVMAKEAKRLGFSAFVITDHFYGHEFDDAPQINIDTIKVLRRSKVEIEYKLGIPVIIGLEIPFCGQEVLVFGTSAVNSILQVGINQDLLMSLKDNATVLCHPRLSGSKAIENISSLVDGYERINEGFDFGIQNSFGKGWCNSDAHRAQDLKICYNITDLEIKTEIELINYIKNYEPKFYKGEK